MKKIKLISLSVVLSLPIFLSGCESLFTEDNSPRRHYASESYYQYDGGNYDGGASGGSRSYGSGGRSGSGSSKPRSERPSTSSTADSIESAEVPVEPPSL